MNKTDGNWRNGDLHCSDVKPAQHGLHSYVQASHRLERDGDQFDDRGFGRFGQTRDRTGRDADDRDHHGLDRTGRDVAGTHHATGTPLDVRGFDVQSVHGETGTTLDAEGWDINKRRANGKVHVKGRDFYGMRVQ